MEKIPAPINSELRYEPPRLRSIKTRIGISGFLTRCSIATKIANRTTAAMKKLTVSVAVQPIVAARLKP